MYQVKMEYVKKFSHVTKREWEEQEQLEPTEKNDYLSFLVNNLIDEHCAILGDEDMTLLDDLQYSLKRGKLDEFIRVWGDDILVSLGEMDLFVKIEKI